jgi:hypothetical protein
MEYLEGKLCFPAEIQMCVIHADNFIRPDTHTMPMEKMLTDAMGYDDMDTFPTISTYVTTAMES